MAQHEGSFRKYTEYARLTLALTAIGRDPTNVGGYDLLETLCDYDKMISVGINGASWALLALVRQLRNRTHRSLRPRSRRTCARRSP